MLKNVEFIEADILEENLKKWINENIKSFKSLCEKYNIVLSDEDILSPKTIHAITASAVAKNEYGMKDIICSAIQYHTTGRCDMTLFEKILLFYYLLVG